ncbi:phosphoribosylglycinamide formyltransferase [Lachnoclostridium sp. An76]|nr:phosphoribosylglycinamide formyltransferase [Lachnoclostridium sp. An76]OUN33921.1 phosphoribosylglycinamide formyltransferase [Lachnoclostridium sp. An76]
MLETKAGSGTECAGAGVREGKSSGPCRIVVMVSGGGTNLQAIIDRVKDGSITNTVIAGVISNNRNAYALKRAEENGIPSKCISPKDYETREIFNEKLLEAVNGYEPDLVVLAGFLVVIPPEMTAQYRNRMINIHPSLIPSFCGKGYYGLKVHEAALQRGVKVVGATVHFVDEGTDTGPIILQKAVEVEQGDTPEILQRRVMEQAEWKILPRAIDLIANGRVTVEGSHAVISK